MISRILEVAKDRAGSVIVEFAATLPVLPSLARRRAAVWAVLSTSTPL